LAGYKNLSATSFMCKTGSQGTEKAQSRATPRKPGARAYSVTEHDKKIYIECRINKFRVISLIGSGSDLSILHYSVYKKIRPQGSGDSWDNSGISHITTFSGQDIKIKGTVSWLVKPFLLHPGLLTKFHIIQDIHGIPDILLGNDILKNHLGTVGYSGSVISPTPEVIFRSPIYTACKVYHVSPTEMTSCSAYVKLAAKELADVEFVLSPSAPVTRCDFVLITAQYISGLYIVPSRSDITFDSALGAYTCTVCVANVTSKPIEDFVLGKWEIINNSTAVAIDDKNIPLMKRIIKNHPLSRELLYTDKGAHIRFPVSSINLLNTISNPKYSQKSDFLNGDCVISREPTYEGEALITEEIIEGGLDLPTIIYDTAEEAVGLHLYTPELRKYIKHIFVDKYPESVSLHSLDAGDLSHTLGYTSLRLREGETLPRSRRIFHVSPGEQRHMDDILDLLLKFKIYCTSPCFTQWVPSLWHEQLPYS